MSTQTKRATIYFDPSIHQALKYKSIETSRSISTLVNEAVKAALSEDADDEVNEVRLFHSSDKGLKIGQDVLDVIALAIPSKRLCLKECKGLCAYCGVNLNHDTCHCLGKETDPRWDALKNIKFDDSSMNHRIEGDL